MLTRGQDYAHQQPSLTRKKLRRLEITAGAPRPRRPGAAGIWQTNQLDGEAELVLAARKPRLLKPGPCKTNAPLRPHEKRARA
jgi:hypothetical protein